MNPRVFQPGAVTLVVDGSSRSLYVGAVQLSMFSRLAVVVDVETGSQIVSVEYGVAHDQETRTRMEEEKRLLASLGWLVQRPTRDPPQGPPTDPGPGASSA